MTREEALAWSLDCMDEPEVLAWSNYKPHTYTRAEVMRAERAMQPLRDLLAGRLHRWRGRFEL